MADRTNGPTSRIWRDGQMVNWEDATIHVMSHVVHYGSSVFEGIRCYETPGGPAIFRPDPSAVRRSARSPHGHPHSAGRWFSVRRTVEATKCGIVPARLSRRRAGGCTRSRAIETS